MGFWYWTRSREKSAMTNIVGHDCAQTLLLPEGHSMTTSATTIRFAALGHKTMARRMTVADLIMVDVFPL